jgi:hypothetical protein
MTLSKFNITPRIRQHPPHRPKLRNMKNALFRDFLLIKARFWPLEKHTNSSAQTALISPSSSRNQSTIAKFQSTLSGPLDETPAEIRVILHTFLTMKANKSADYAVLCVAYLEPSSVLYGVAV